MELERNLLYSLSSKVTWYTGTKDRKIKKCGWRGRKGIAKRGESP
jgi:hypothetical protein